ncbi:DUF7657 domain-containing protein [Escherichia coli]
MKTLNINDSRLYLLICLLFGVIYVTNAWSPSSYSLALDGIGIDAHPDFGKARAIRSDEWVVQTPLTQALVNNGFERFNHTSIYKEDLRINYGLPIFDWGLIFKPAQWGYLILPPAYAFSLYYFALFAFFVIGFQKIIKIMGADELSAFLLSVAFYFTGSVQFWWTVNASTFAFFPWVLYSLYNIKSSSIYAILLFWFLACWQIGNLYPPFTYALLLVAIVWIWNVVDLRTVKLRELILAIAAGIAAVVVVYLYFHDYIELMKNTVYPGVRSENGGSIISWAMFQSLFFPSLWFDKNYELLKWKEISNICQISTWATLLPVLILFYTNYKKVRLTLSFNLLDKFLIPALCVMIMLLWTMFPVPAALGKYLFLDKVPAVRMMLGLGLVVNILAVIALIRIPLNVTARRIGIFTIIYAGLFIIFKGGIKPAQVELIALLIGALVSLVLIRFKNNAMLALSSITVIYSLAVFFAFNPLQDSRFIFHKNYQTPAIEIYKQQVNQYGVALAAMSGSIINGLEYPSGNHVLTTPQLAFWYKKFPNLNKEEMNKVFNRYAHIHLVPESNVIELSATDVISVPQRCFMSGIDTPCKNVSIKK